MTSTTRALTGIETAQQAADLAAARAGVQLAEAHDVGDLRSIARLLATIWATDEARSPVSADLMRAFSHAGNYVATARLDGAIVGASVGFLHLAGSTLKLHSHITGIAPDAQGRSIGTALKHHQRAWALARGIDTITWTFDPLVRRNAWFNLVKLGAAITAYHPLFYGSMEDGVNAGDESDRCVAEWALEPGPTSASAPADTSALLDAGGEVGLDEDADGAPVLRPTSAPVRLLRLPADVVGLRAADPAAALAWRRALRAAFTDAMAAGLHATTMTTDGCYVMTAPTIVD